MAKSRTTFSKDHQPDKTRGKSERTKIIDALEKQGHDEAGFYQLLTMRAMDPDDSFAMREVLNRLYPMAKAVAPTVQFEFDPEGSAVRQATQMVAAIAGGQIPPDIGSSLVSSIKTLMDIEEATLLKDRITELEKVLNIDGG